MLKKLFFFGEMMWYSSGFSAADSIFLIIDEYACEVVGIERTT